MRFAGLVKSSMVDFPGKIAAVLFVPGCNYDCFYCHNRSLLDGSYTLLPEEDVQGFLQKRAGLLDGLVISGGEPTLQSGLQEFIREAKELGYQIKLDTNGSNPHVVEQLLAQNLCDYYAVDYKAPASCYHQVCGKDADPHPVHRTIGLLLAHKADFELRTTVFPQLSPEDMVTMAAQLPAVPRWVLNPYRLPLQYKPEDAALLKAAAPNKADLLAFAAAMKARQPNITVPAYSF